MTAEQQATLKEAGQTSANVQRELWQAREAASMEKVQAGGTTVNKIPDKAPFQAAMAPVYEQFLTTSPDLEGLVNMIRSAN